ncbi:hypothetical protein CDAR_172381 [Caerostris darwini]|uniref:Uncharacterized protein n=1 Tax=Caerostris darwini TaxID=1538125 RepID=A0AAV4ME75_9ARAC|nr:hypothetical protein CDAR_172381 [Caerostris darwini]
MRELIVFVLEIHLLNTSAQQFRASPTPFPHTKPNSCIVIDFSYFFGQTIPRPLPLFTSPSPLFVIDPGSKKSSEGKQSGITLSLLKEHILPPPHLGRRYSRRRGEAGDGLLANDIFGTDKSFLLGSLFRPS